MRTLLALVLLASCDHADTEPAFGQAPPTAEAPAPLAGADSDPIDVAGGEAASDVGEEPSDGGDGPTDGDDEGWDPAPPPGQFGTVLHFEWTCGFMRNVFQAHWEWDGAGWKQRPGPGEGGEPRPELAPCLTDQGDKRLEWFPDGSMYLESAGLAHWIEPSPTPHIWFANVEPLEQPSAACLEGLAMAGTELPIQARAELTGIDAP